MNVLYCRCSTVEQNEARQIALREEIKADKVFVDKCSGKNADRPELKKMLAYVREGDFVFCSDISRIARNTRDLLSIVDELQNKKVEFVSLKEHIDTSNPQGKFMLTVFAALAELERESILQRQAEGIAIAKANGIYKGRKPMTYDKEKFSAMCMEWRQGKRTATSICKSFGITSTTFYRWIKEQQKCSHRREHFCLKILYSIIE